MGFNSSKKAAKAQEAAYRAQAHNYLQQGQIYLQSAAAQAAVGGRIAGTAKFAIQAGKANAKQERLMASRIQAIEDIQLQKVNKERRQKIGSGRAAFAANGVLVDSGAAGMWEQDEAADAAIEKLMVMQAAEDQAYGHLTRAQGLLAQGYSQASSIYANAGSAYSNAAQSAAQGISSALNAMGALKGANGVQGPSGWGLGLNIAGHVLNAAGSIYDAYSGTDSGTDSGTATKASK